MMKRDKDVFAKEGYIENAIVYACVTKIASAFASIDIDLYQTKGDKSIEIEQHPVLALLNRPSPNVSGFAFKEALVSNLLIYGEAAILRNPMNDGIAAGVPPKELWNINPKAIRPIEGRGGMPIAYEVGLQQKVRIPVNQVTGECDLLFIKKYNPLSDFTGLSPMEAAAYSTDIFNSGQKWNKALLDNGARPSGALTVEGKDGETKTLTDDQFMRLKEELDSNYSGAKNAARPLLLEGGLKWIEMGLNPKDMDYKENLFTAARWIAGAYGVPPQLINIPAESTYNNLAEAKIAFYMDTVLPLADKLVADINHWLIPMFDKTKAIALKVDEDSIPALEPRREILYRRANESKFLTINEKRRMAGFDDVEGGDVLLVEGGGVPLDMVGDTGIDDASYQAWADAQKE
jgi:HK97 family phage portal protein